MTNQKQTRFQTYFEEKIAACKSLEQKLAAEERTDEAVFAKIQGNVFEIFQTILSAALANSADDAHARQFFCTKLEQLPQKWCTSQEEAEDHGDLEKAHIEAVKLEAASEIKTAYETVWEVEL